MKFLKGLWSTIAVAGIVALMVAFKHTEVMDPQEKTAIQKEMKKAAAQAEAEARQAAAKTGVPQEKPAPEKPADESAE